MKRPLPCEARPRRRLRQLDWDARLRFFSSSGAAAALHGSRDPLRDLATASEEFVDGLPELLRA